MKHAQKMCTNLGQVDTVITFDLAIYTKAKQIQMKFPEEFSGTVIRLRVDSKVKGDDGVGLTQVSRHLLGVFHNCVNCAELGG